MEIRNKSVEIKNGRSLVLRSPQPEESKMMLDHLKVAHAESCRNLNQTAQYWDTVSVEDETKILADFLNSKSKFMLCAFDAAKIVGGLGFVGGVGDFLKHTGRIGMSIQNAYCNSGLGTEMMAYAISSAREHGFHRIELTVRTYNQAGISLYEKVGFGRVGLLKDAAFIGNEYVDEYMYQLVLNGSR